MVDFGTIAKEIKSVSKRELAILWIFSVLLGLMLVVLSNKNKLPLGKGDFVFVSLLALLFALYRPRWTFFLFICLIPLENIILASGFLPIQLRPYQFLGGILAAAIAILHISKHLQFEILKPNWFDWAIFSLVPFSFLALFHAPAKNISLKNNIVLLSFIVLYYLIRNFARSKHDLIKTAFFFFGSFIVVTVYGFFQVFADKFGRKSFEVMFGRPNSTFTEADWLGIFLGFSLAVLLSLMFYFVRSKQKFFAPRKYILLFLDILVFLNMTLSILTLSRSAWIGTVIIIIFYFLALVPTRKLTIVKIYAGNWRIFFREVIIIFIIFIISVAAIKFGKLSKFDIFDRARSTATSEQKITIACDNRQDIPPVIADTNELVKYNCRHINLEEIEANISQGKIITEIFRRDPNVMTRSAIYRKSFEIIKQHPVLGVGFGTITQTLGIDERGAGLNESNLFLQVWAGSGILGLIAFVFVIGYLFVYAFRRVSPACPMNKFFGCPIVKDNFEKAASVFAVLGIVALIIPNLFNAGLLMGTFWLGLAVIVNAKNIRPDSL